MQPCMFDCRILSLKVIMESFMNPRYTFRTSVPWFRILSRNPHLYTSSSFLNFPLPAGYNFHALLNTLRAVFLLQSAVADN